MAYKSNLFLPKIAWTTKRAKNEWENILYDSSCFSSRIAIESVREGLRDCVIIRGNDVKCVPRGLTEKTIIVEISKTSKKRISIWFVKENQNIKRIINEDISIRIEDLLSLEGLPKCCIQKTVDLMQSKEHPWNPFVDLSNISLTHLLTIDNSKLVKGIPCCNSLLTNLGIRLIPFYSCSFKCNSTEVLSKRYSDLAKFIDEAKYNNLVRLLEMPLRVESLFGIGTTYSPFFMFTHNTDFAKQKKVILYESISNQFFNIESTKAQVSGKNYPHNILKKFCDE
tara:strand:+ start:1344 stop:2189 length:846 start_codon:yes stop_codon:yes gene_type:complete